MSSLCYSSVRTVRITLQRYSSASTDDGAAYTGRLVSMGKKKKNMYWENCGFFLQKSETFPLHFSPTSLTKLPRSILYRIWWAFHQRHGNLISAFFFCRNLCKSADYSHAMASATPHLLFCRQTPLIQSYLNWTQHSH